MPTAFAKLVAARPHMRTIGGSHAQRDVFERITVDAGLRAGQYDAVTAILAERMDAAGRDRRRLYRKPDGTDCRNRPG